MKDRKKRTIIIGILCCLLVFMGAGFAVLNATLNINGTANIVNTWNVRMTKIDVLEKSEGTTNSGETAINEDGVSAKFKTEFTKPGDYITYEITVENKGSIDAILNDISITLNVAEADKDLFNITDTRPNNQLLEAGTSITFTVKVEFREDADRIPSGDIEYTVKVDYSQETGDIIEGGETEEEWLYKIDESGTIIAYNYDSSLTADASHVVVPAEVDGIPVKTINSGSFIVANTRFYQSESGFMYIIIYEQEPNFTNVKNKIINGMAGCSPDSAECLDNLRDTVNFCTDINTCYDVVGKVTGSIPAGVETQGGIEINPDPTLTFEESATAATRKITHLDLSQAIYLETIGNSSFSNGYGVDEIRVEEVMFPINGMLKTIGDWAFAESNLESITIPASVEFIGEYVFNHDVQQVSTKRIKTLIFEDNSNLKTIGKTAFANNDISNDLILPEKLIEIGSYSFSGNDIPLVVVPSSVTNIGDGAFSSQKDSQRNSTLQTVVVKRTKEDFLASVTAGSNWFDKALISEPTYDPNY